MEPARKTAKAPVTAPPVHVPRAKPSPGVTSAAGLQSRIGATGVQKLMTSRAGKPAPGKGAATPEAVNDQAAAHVKKGKPTHGKPAHGKHESTGDEKPKSEAGPAQEESGGGAAAAAAIPVKMHMPEPPTKPSKATTARIKSVKGRVGGKAKAQGTLPAADKQVGEVKKAVTPPEAERIAKAREELIAELKPAPSPEILELCEKIRKVIREKRPPDEDALVKAEPAKEAMDAGNTLNSNIESQNKAVTTNYGPMEGPPTPGAEQKGKPLEPQPNAAPTPAINAKAAVPDKVPPQSVSLDKDAEESRKKAEAAGMNKPAAALVQSGPIAEAREAQGELDQAAKEDPAKVLAKQEEALAKAQQDMTALQDRALAALVQSRAGTAGKTSARQKSMVGTDEEKRTAASNEAKEVFNQAQSDVRAQLKDLIPTAMADWEASKARITSQFKYDLSIVAEKVKKRHEGVGGFFRGLKDSAFGLPDWATEAYDDAEYVFSESVIKVLKRISAHVDLVIKTCEGIIKAARERIKKIMGDLPPSLQKWAEQEQAKFDKDLDKLGDEVVAERNSFNKQLTESASQAVDEVRAEIADLRKKAGGLVGRIVDAVKRFVDDPVKFIIEGLLELLGISPPAFWAVVAKIKKVVRDIIDDPVGFANNLLKGIGQGFSQFFDNFAGHMIRGFLTWLLGDLKDVQIPKEISLKSIITFFLQLMGITWPNIRKILAKKIGEKNVALIEKVYSLITMLIEKGPEGIYEMIKEKLDPQSILDQVIDMAVEFMVTAIAKQVAARLLLLFNPAGAILQAIEAIYRVLKWVFQNAAKIFTLIETIVNGLADIIAGNVGGFANAVEKGLAMLIPPVLGFVADYFSLGDLPKMVAKQIKGFREWILGKIEAGFDWVIAKGKALLAALGIGGKDKDKKGAGDDTEIGETVHWTAEDESHELWIEEHGESVEVMMASANKGPVSKKLTEYAQRVPKLQGPGSKDRKKRANDAIADARKELAGTTTAAKATKAAKGQDQKGDVKAKDKETESWEERLWPQLQIIQIALRDIPLPPTVILPGSGRADSVTARPLSKKGGGGSGPRGKLAGWPLVAGMNPQWVAAHLVSEKLHGPGDPWNTTPMRTGDNTRMERAIESKAKERVNNEEVVYYTASVTYHQDSDDPRMNDFPNFISVSWGRMRYDNNNKTWVDDEAYDPYGPQPLKKPDLDDATRPDINELRRDALNKRGVPMRFAMAMDDERNKGGDFTGMVDFRLRMTIVYKTKGGSSPEDKLDEGVAAVRQLIADKKVKWPK